MGLRSGRVAKWFASQLITGERPSRETAVDRGNACGEMRVRVRASGREAGHRQGMPGVSLGRMH